jgi:hypothetical protein
MVNPLAVLLIKPTIAKLKPAIAKLQPVIAKIELAGFYVDGLLSAMNSPALH